MKEKIISKQQVFDDFFKVEKWYYQYEKENGELTDPVDRMVLKRQDAASVILYNTDRNVVLLSKQFRHCTYEKGPGWMIEAIAGRLDEGEQPEETIRREALEEIGYKLHDLEKIAMVYSSPGYSTERMHIYYGLVKDADKIEQGGGLIEEGEYIEPYEMTIEELNDAIKKHELIDSKTVIAANYLLKKHGY